MQEKQIGRGILYVKHRHHMIDIGSKVGAVIFLVFLSTVFYLQSSR